MSSAPSSPAMWRRLMVLAVAAALVTAVAAALLRLNMQPPTPSEDAASTTGESVPAVTEPSAAAPCAYLGEWEGRLAVFRTPDAPPEEVCDVFLAALPAEEQRLLRARIPVYSEEELRGLLEDYTG